MPVRPPNILWIVTTQWRGQALGYAGDPNARTPWLDALAGEAVNFTQAVTPHPFGPFARAALLTGVPSPQNGVRDYFDPLPSDAPTVARALGARGYTTAFFGKWHLARRDSGVPLVGEAHARMIVPPEARGGFEVWDGFESGFLLNDPWLHGHTSETPVQVRGYQSDVVCGRAADYLAGLECAGRPWFAVVSLEAPHPPYDAPAAGVTARAPETLVLPANVPRGGEVEARARKELTGYYAHIEATDRAIGQALLSRVNRSETAVVFTSVHGDMHGAHARFRKGWPHEESVRVPLLVRLPEGASSGCDSGRAATSSKLVSLLDLSRWAIDWAKGQEATLTTTGDVQRISMPSVVALPQQCDRVWHGVRTAARKTIFNADGSPWLFFDLEQDP
ncbi:MAG: sulfatase-like hydrolase/transferase, partial [Verrucomicrobiota bacterium]